MQLTAWGQYINGNVVSELSRRFIINIMMCTTAPLMETPGDSSDSGENDEDIDLSTLEVGGMSLVRRTLQGMRDNDEGAIGFGRYSSSIRLGRDLWQSPLLAMHMLVHSIMAGASIFLILSLFMDFSDGFLAFAKRPNPPVP